MTKPCGDVGQPRHDSACGAIQHEAAGHARPVCLSGGIAARVAAYVRGLHATFLKPYTKQKLSHCKGDKDIQQK
jgi:hypothetical protein